MRRYTIKVAGTEHVMDVEAIDIDTFRVHLDDGRVVDVDLEDHQDLAHSVISPDQAKVAGRHPDDPRARSAEEIPVARPRPDAPDHAPPGHTAPSHATAAASAANRAAAPRRPSGAAGGAAPAGATAGAATGATAGRAGGAGTLTAPMPGVVLSVEATVGTAVARGDVILVLEAMKMNNPLRAPRDGVVAEIMVEAGQNVAFGAPLARVEPA